MTIGFLINSRIKADSRQNIQIRIVHTRNYRKLLTTSLNVFKKHFDLKEFRCKPMHPDYKSINKQIKAIKDKKEHCINQYESKKFTLRQVELHMLGKSDYTSIDDFINTDYKRLKRDVTFNDYLSKFKTIKSNMGINGKISFDEIDYNWLEDLYDTLRKKGLAKKTIRSYSTALSVILGDAVRKGIIDKKPIFPKNLTSGGKRDRKRKELKITNSEDFEKYIENITTIQQWQSFAFWLLSFCLRGFYPADIVKMESAELVNPTHWSYLNGRLFISHLRSKSEHTENEHMYVNIPTYVYQLINMLKESVVFTHSEKHRNIVAKRQDILKIFDYDPSENYKFHLQRWALHTRKLRPYGMDMMSGRKTFNTIAKGLKIDQDTRLILLGRQADPILARSYDDNFNPTIQNNVFEAHRMVLEEYRADILIYRLQWKLSKLNVPKWLNPYRTVEESIFLKGVKPKKTPRKGFEWYFNQPEYEWKIKISKKEQEELNKISRKRIDKIIEETKKADKSKVIQFNPQLYKYS